MLVLGVAAVIVIAVVQHPSQPLATPAPHTSSTPAPSPPASTTTPSSPALAALVTRAPSSTPAVVELHHSILGVTAGWELFARSSDSVIRIEPAKGRVTRTAFPGLSSSGPVSFLAGPDLVIVRPLDFGPGYEVIDGEPAHLLAGTLAIGGPVLPGPDPKHVWAIANRNSDALTVTDWAGRPSSTHVAAPADSSVVGATSDGGGQVLYFSGQRGVFLAGTFGNRLLTGGTLNAINARTMVVTNCDPETSCVTSVVDRATSERRRLAHAVASEFGPGLVSPDNHYAVLVTTAAAASSSMDLTLLDLNNGSRTTLPRSLGVPDSSQMVFTPDGRWLFVVATDGRIVVIDPATDKTSDVGVALPAVRQIAIRPAPDA